MRKLTIQNSELHTHIYIYYIISLYWLPLVPTCCDHAFFPDSFVILRLRPFNQLQGLTTAASSWERDDGLIRSWKHWTPFPGLTPAVENSWFVSVGLRFFFSLAFSGFARSGPGVLVLVFSLGSSFFLLRSPSCVPVKQPSSHFHPHLTFIFLSSSFSPHCRDLS